jgi:hypothetical protein
VNSPGKIDAKNGCVYTKCSPLDWAELCLVRRLLFQHQAVLSGSVCHALGQNYPRAGSSLFFVPVTKYRLPAPC